MAINDNKITQVEIDANNVKSTSDTPTGTSTEIKNIFDKLPELIATRFNSLIDGLKSIVSGASGADNIGIGTDTGLTGATVKAQIKELKDGKIDANAPITGATKCKVTYDAKGLVTSGADLSKTDLPTEALLSDNLITAIVGSRTDKIVSEKALADFAISTGAGDMLKSVFDTTGKNQDIFAYADSAATAIVNTIGQPNGITELDETTNVPIDRLGNVSYLQDNYGRKANHFDIATANFYKICKSGIDFNLLWDISNLCHMYVNSIAYSTSLGTSGASLMYTCSHVSTIFTSFSTEKYDLTDIDYVDISMSIIQNIVTSVGFTDTNTTTTNNNFSGVSANFGPYESGGGSPKLDVRALSGEYYFKIYHSSSATMTPSTLRIDSVKFTSSKNLTTSVDKVISLKPNTLSENFTNTFTMESGFIDWYNLNSLVTTPVGTSVIYDVYDENNILLKADVKQGELLKLANPIINVKSTFTRDLVGTASPTMEWLEVGMRGVSDEVGAWQDLGGITLSIDTTQIDITIPNGIDEVQIDGYVFAATSAVMNCKFNNIASSIYSYSCVTFGSSYDCTYNTNNPALQLTKYPADVGVPILINISIENLKSGKKVFVNARSMINGGTTTGRASGNINNTDAVTKISLLVSTGAYKAGTILKVWGR